MDYPSGIWRQSTCVYEERYIYIYGCNLGTYSDNKAILRFDTVNITLTHVGQVLTSKLKYTNSFALDGYLYTEYESYNKGTIELFEHDPANIVHYNKIKIYTTTYHGHQHS